MSAAQNMPREGQSGTDPGPMFTFTTSSSRPTRRVECHHCGWSTSGSMRVFEQADVHVCLPRCDECGAIPKRPAIDLGLLVFCARCAPLHGMFPGEHGEARPYEQWRRLAAIAQGRLA